MPLNDERVLLLAMKGFDVRPAIASLGTDDVNSTDFYGGPTDSPQFPHGRGFRSIDPSTTSQWYLTTYLTKYNLTPTFSDTGKPKRCLTAYNIFFQQERQRLLKTLPARAGVKSKKAHGKIGFAELGRAISRSWKSVTAEQKAYYRKLAAQDKKRYQREMEEWKAKLAERDVEIELAAPKSAPEQTTAISGSVVMDDSFAPTPHEPVVSGEFKAPDMMSAMPTEDLIMLACGDTFLDSGNAPAPAPVHSLESEPYPYQADKNPKTVNKAVTPVQPLDTDCQDFLMSAFGI